ncbi:MAG: sigma-70 family RNA polymerase sigma factor [bacterium]|nr:sigma-70 family RNA polymerase sigma factor [bacterium]
MAMHRNSPAGDLTTLHVRGAAGGDANSLRWLVERFSPLLHAVAARRLGPRLRASYDPADVVQDVWTAVLPKLGALELRGARATPTVLKYLTTAVVNRVRNLLERHLARQLTGEPDEPDLEELKDSASGILTKAVRAESAVCVHRALEELTDSDREIVILRGLEQQSLPAVAEQLGIEPGTASVRFHRALKRLQQKLPDSVFADLESVDA